jgi:hypothetical protein
MDKSSTFGTTGSRIGYGMEESEKIIKQIAAIYHNVRVKYHGLLSFSPKLKG